MFIGGSLLCSNLRFSYFYISNLARKLIPVFLEQRMERNIINEIKKLFDRLKQANTEAERLKFEITDIRNQIKLLSKSDIFKQFLENFRQENDDISNSDDDIDASPPNKKPKFDFATDGDYVVIYTDGACENNGKIGAKAGIGVWFGENHPLNISKPVQGKATNNVAEIQACIKALQIANQNDIKKVKIKTDSKFTINCITQWIHKWKKNNWKLTSGGHVKNKQELIKLDEMCKLFSDIKWEHVAGHCGHKGNEEADKLARLGANNYIVS